MKKLPNITLSDKELALIIDENIFDYGGEAVVCRNNNPHTLYKIFVKSTGDIPAVMSDNKLKKLIWLYQYQPEELVSPVSTLSNNGNLIGYEMTYDEDDEALINVCLTESEKIHYLHETASLLQRLAPKDLTYGDIKDDNILINRKTNRAKLCDIDNIRIGQYPIDVMGHGLSDYFDITKKIDDKADAFMHNLFLLQQLKYDDLSYKLILTHLKTNPTMTEFPEEARKILSTLTHPETFEGEYAIQYIKRK